MVPAPSEAGQGTSKAVDWVLPTLCMDRVDGAGLVCTLRAPRTALPPALTARLAAAGGGSPAAPEQQLRQNGVQGEQQKQHGEQQEEEGGEAGVEVTVALGNRRLMAQQGVEIGQQVGVGVGWVGGVGRGGEVLCEWERSAACG